MKISTLALFALGTLAVAPAWAQQSYSSSRTTTTTTVQPTYLSPGEPLAAAQTTQEYVPNRSVVSAVQQRLAQLGYNVEQSGDYDASLRNNVLRFQSDTGLRPTGNVDLATIGALGINVEPVGQATAMAPTTTVVEQTAQVNDRFDFPLERTEHMSAPQVRDQATQWESTTGIEMDANQVQVGEQPPGFPPGYPLEDLY